MKRVILVSAAFFGFALSSYAASAGRKVSSQASPDIVVLASPSRSEKVSPTVTHTIDMRQVETFKTTFQVREVLKGNAEEALSFKYWVYTGEDGVLSPAPISRCLLDFRGRESDLFLLSLKTHQDGSLSPFTGQEDPCGSVKKVDEFNRRLTNR